MSVVSQFTPATSAEAIRWYRHKLHLETDCADVHGAQRAGEVDFVLLHVVGSEEAFARRHLPGALHVPHTELRGRIEEVRAAAEGRPVRALCGSGVRSHIANRVLSQAGFDSASLSGGMLTLRAVLGEGILVTG